MQMYKKILLYVIGLHVPFILGAQGYKSVPPGNASPFQTIATHLNFQSGQTETDIRPCFSAQTDLVTATRLSQQLKNIFAAKGLRLDPNRIPRQPDYLDSLTYTHTFVIFPHELPDVYLEKLDSSWVYSQQTVDRMPALMKDVFPLGSDFLIQLMPVHINRSFMGLQAWQYLGLLLLIFVVVVIYFIFYFLFHWLLAILAKTRLSSWDIDKRETWKVARLISFLIILQIIQGMLPYLQFRVNTSSYLITLLAILKVILFLGLALRFTTIVFKHLFELALKTANRMDEQIVPIVKMLVKIGLGVSAFFYILKLLNVNVTALIAGLSIGGLILALAAQDTVKNLLGSLMIFIDRPFQIGDFVQVEGQEGTIEEVGFRTTRIRTANTSLIAIPNGNLANISVNNLGVRPQRIIDLKLAITYDTPVLYLQKFKAGLVAIISQHTKLNNESYHVYLRDLGDSALVIMFRAYIDTNMFAEELEVREEVLWSILTLADDLGIRFAFPTQTVHIEQQPGYAPLTPHLNKSAQQLDEIIKTSLKKSPKV